jgi:exo-beta-1,3-glucanase (GH17 family)/cellulose synthase/poly-beta-1,6-N-acetylglucosamine synthase-like glycosyltransferase
LRRWGAALAVAATAAIVNFAAWRALNPPLHAPDVPARVAGLAYNAFQRHDSPLAGELPSEADIEADLRRLAPLTPRLRTYSASELPQLPALADRHGLRLALGVWLEKRAERNEREITAAIDAARRHRSVERVIAGNETLLHRTLEPAELAAVLARLRAALRVPVSTAEPWHVWLREPALVREVDFITVHLLPYWEGVPAEAALDEALRRYRELRERYPGKPIVIGEIGWPSGGHSVQARWSLELSRSAPAVPSPAAQANFVRRFLQVAERERLDYYLMEAIDQPWKRATEGQVGAHWGLLDASRRPKFEFSGPVHTDPYWSVKAAWSSALGFVALPSLLLAFGTIGWRGRWVLAAAVQGVASLAVVLGLLPLADYLRPLDLAVMALLVPALALLAAILLTQVVEFAEMHWPAGLRRRAAPRPWAGASEAAADISAPHDGGLAERAAGAVAAGFKEWPFVSVHLACCNEPPAQVIATIDSLVALDWPALEVLVVDNNTTDPALWQPVRAHVEQLKQAPQRRGQAARVRFFQLPNWPGYKAGALNFALERMDARTQWVAVVDADYVVRRDWLRQLAGWFSEPAVAAVQSPQAHRDFDGSALERMMNWEYEGFFRIGMHHRHERNAVIQHGTMTLVRATSLRAAGRWAEDCVCEDTELGLRLLARGERVVYVDRVVGTGLVPADFTAYARQRHRWAEGGMQILRRHARDLFAWGPTRLTLAQRYHFVAGWLPWLGDAAHLVFSVAAMLWTVGVLLAPTSVGPPIGVFVLPLAVFFVARLAMTPLLYRRLVVCNFAERAGAAVAGIALSHAVARGVLAGLTRRRAVFHVTRKGHRRGQGHGRADDHGGGDGDGDGATERARVAVKAHGWVTLRPVREEGALLAGLTVCMVAALLHPAAWGAGRAGWLLILGLQALPYAAALGCAWLSARDERKPVIGWATPVTVTVAAFAVALWVRYGLVEPAGLTAQCDAEPWNNVACTVRALVVQGFVDQRIGLAALACGLVVTWSRSLVFATLGLAGGAAGLVLYSPGPAAAGLLLAALVCVRAGAAHEIPRGSAGPLQGFFDPLGRPVAKRRANQPEALEESAT